MDQIITTRRANYSILTLFRRSFIVTLHARGEADSCSNHSAIQNHSHQGNAGAWQEPCQPHLTARASQFGQVSSAMGTIDTKVMRALLITIKKRRRAHDSDSRTVRAETRSKQLNFIEVLGVAPDQMSPSSRRSAGVSLDPAGNDRLARWLRSCSRSRS